MYKYIVTALDIFFIWNVVAIVKIRNGFHCFDDNDSRNNNHESRSCLNSRELCKSCARRSDQFTGRIYGYPSCTAARRKIKVSWGEVYAELSANEDATTEQRAGASIIFPGRLLRLALKTLNRSTFKWETQLKGKKNQNKWKDRFY